MVAYFQSKYSLLSGTSYDEVLPLARREYHMIQKRNPRRQAYVRSRYFGGDKVFITLFWDHLSQKRRIDRLRRLKYYRCALDLLRYSRVEPQAILEKQQIFYRFYGLTKEGHAFCVQVKLDGRSGRKDLISIFPVDENKQKRPSAG